MKRNVTWNGFCGLMLCDKGVRRKIRKIDKQDDFNSIFYRR